MQIAAFLFFSFASDMTLIEHGTELSLWLMSFAIALSMAVTIFPWVGIRWLQLEPRGCQCGSWLSHLVQFASWISFSYALLLRWGRNLDSFYWWITLTSILWPAWLFIFLINRHACHPFKSLDKESGDTLRTKTNHQKEAS